MALAPIENQGHHIDEHAWKDRMANCEKRGVALGCSFLSCVNYSDGTRVIEECRLSGMSKNYIPFPE